MIKITLDAETFYSKDHSLRVMTPIQYIRSPQYETIGWGVALNDNEPVWLEGDRVATLLRKVTEPWICITHNALFDCCILAYRYDIHPTLCVDTMSMARALLSPWLPRGSVSLEKVSGYLQIGNKAAGVLASVLGLRLEQIKDRPELYESLKDYCKGDVKLTREIYRQLSSRFPATEHAINDMIIKMATQPQFQVDLDALYEHKNNIMSAKNTLMERVGLDRFTLASDDKFAEALRTLGREPQQKPSPADPSKLKWAFAKTDQQMEDLLEDDDPDIQALAAARIGVKSTLEETRTNRFIDIATVTFDGNNSWMPIPLKFSGAHTHRFSGEWKINAQNLPSRKTTALRKSLVAPAGKVCMAVDAAQIEARLTAWLSGQLDLVSDFAAGVDIYANFASDLYHWAVTRKNKLERLLGKISVLALGFGMGEGKFIDTVRIGAADQGVEIDLSAVGGGGAVVRLYRGKYRMIVKTWRWLDEMIVDMHAGRAEGVRFGPCVFHSDRITLPSGLELFYLDLKYEPGSGWSYWDGRKRKPIWGGTMLENIVQALDRVAVMEAALRIKARFKAAGIDRKLAHQVHDELIYLPLLSEVSTIKPILLGEMSKTPKWGYLSTGLALPLAAEVKIGASYGAME